AGIYGWMDLPQQLALRRIDNHTAHRKIQISFSIGTNAIRSPFEVRDHDTIVRGAAVAIQIEAVDTLFLRIRYIQNLPIGRKRHPIRTRLPPGDRLEFSFRLHMVHAKEIEIAVIERRIQRITEIDVSVPPDHDVIRRIETLAFEPFGQNFDSSL